MKRYRVWAIKIILFLGFLGCIAYAGVLLYVAWHFVSKYW